MADVRIEQGDPGDGGRQQPAPCRRPKTKNSSVWLKGDFVRARIQAMVTANGKNLIDTVIDQISTASAK
jgi:hypothetical protein